MSVDAEDLALVARAARPTSGRPLVLALIPAHNAEDRIGAALESLHSQQIEPDAIVVCADRCTDWTARKAESKFAHVFETVENQHGRAGALNQTLAALLPVLYDDDAVLVMDADSVLAPRFLAEARRHMDDGAGGLSGVFTGRASGGFGLLQPEDYALYARDVTRVYGPSLVSKGMATLFSVGALRHVARARAEGLLPGGTRQIYDTEVLSTDTQLTVALLSLGYKIFARLSAASAPRLPCETG
jgi:glycosyltransferase involved in cell wall biosynthesis